MPGGRLEVKAGAVQGRRAAAAAGTNWTHSTRKTPQSARSGNRGNSIHAIERETAPAARHLAYDGWRAGAGILRELPWAITAYGQAQFSRRDYAAVYPGAGETRADRRLDLSLNLTKRDLVIAGFAPMLQYTFTRNISNVAFHDTHAHGVTLTFTRTF